MSFSSPMWLAALALPLALLVWHALHRARAVALPYDYSTPKRRPLISSLLRMAQALTALLAVVMVLLAAGPTRMVRAGHEREVTNIEICLDVSGSMSSQLGKSSRTTRYQAATQAITQFTEARRGDALGLTIFGGENVRWTPRTQDLDAIRLATPFLDPSKQPQHMNSTRIGAALRACIQTLSEAESGDRMIILLSDGYSSDLGGSAAFEVGADLAAANVSVYAIHVGDGTAPSQLYDIVAECGGRVFAAGDAHGLAEVFEAIDAMQPAKQKPATPQPAPWYQPLALIGLSLLGLHVVCSFFLRETPW